MTIYKTRFTFALLLICMPLAIQAAVYKHVDSEGRLIKYSDQPQHPGDKPIDMPKPAMEYKSEKPAQKSVPKRIITREKPKEETAQEKKAVLAYSAIAILKPENEEAIRANGGAFPIELASQPALDTDSGHRFVIIVDGKRHMDSNTAKFILENMDRGAHSISAEVRDASDNVLVSSSSKTIYVLRASAR